MKAKNLTILIFILLLVLSKTSNAQQTPPTLPLNDTIEVMHVIGLATENGVPLDGVLVKLFKNNEEMECEEISSVPKHDHHFTFDLMGNANYSIQIAKENYVARLVSISTMVPPTFVVDDNNPKTSYDFEVELFKVKKGADDELFDFPIAIVSFNTRTNKFEQHDNYTMKLKSKIDKIVGPPTTSGSKSSNKK